MSGRMSFRERFKRKLGLRSSRYHTTSQNQCHAQESRQWPDLEADGTASRSDSSIFPTGSPTSLLPKTPCLCDQSSQAHPKEGAAQEAAPIRKGSDKDIRELWNLAYEELRDEDERLIRDFEGKIEGDLVAGLSKAVGSQVAKRDWMNTVLTRKMEQVNRDAWKLKFRSSEVLVKELVKPVLGVVSWANGFISKAVSANPSASIAWIGISLLLPLLLNPSEQAASLAKGLEYISSLIVQSHLWEDLYERRSKSEADNPSQTTYRSALTTLYRHVLKFQITSYCYYARSTAYRLGLDSVKWNEWEELLDKIKERERAFSAVLTVCRDVKYDEECFEAKQRHEQVMSCWQSIGTDVSGLLSATGTCSWLIKDSKNFETWMGSPKSFLWLNGKPGSGKSILSSSVIKHLQDKCMSDPGTSLAYFYFNFGIMEYQSVAIMLSSLVKQLCASRPDTPPIIKNFEEYKTKGERPDTRTLENALIASTGGFSDVFIVMDALDECPTLSEERGKLLASLKRIVAAMPDNMHLLCTSRAEPDISTVINTLLCPPSRVAIDLLQDTTGLRSDIGIYINSVLESDDYNLWPGELKADAKRLLTERADGMFQYIVCQFEGLRNLRSRSLIRSALENLPKGLDATYDRLLLSIEPDFQAQTLSLLKWLAFSNTPLKLKELAEIFILHPERGVGVDEAERLFEPKEVLRYVSSLVTLSTKYVRLAHFTVKEYLISSRIGKGPAARFSFTEDDAHLHIAQCCLVYHLHKTDKIWEEGGFPLEKYATGYWGWHLEMVPRHKWTPEIVRLAARALAVRSMSLKNILSHGMVMKTSTERGFRKVRNARLDHFLRRPYCYTASLGLLSLTDLLLSTASDTYDYLTPEDLDLTLQQATLVGGLEIVQLALDKGAHVDTCTQDDKRRSVLQVAATRNRPEIVKLLLSRGADTYKLGCPLTSALSSLFINRFHPMLEQSSTRTRLAERSRSLQLLIDNGADINKQCAIHGTALSVAASKMTDHDTRHFLDFLLQRGAVVNLSCAVFGSPLQAACSHRVSTFSYERGYEPMHSSDVLDDAAVMTLLEMGAEVNAQGGKYGNALQAASYAGNYQVVCLLLARGADKNMSGGHFGTALQAACAGGHERIVDVLLDSGADVDVPGGIFGSALQAACANRNWKIASMLLDRAAEVSLQGGVYGNALQAACYAVEGPRESHSKIAIVQQLLEKGADVNATGGEFGSALQAASSSRSEASKAIIALLLSKSAEINKRGGLYGTAVQGASARGRVDIVRLLLDHGSDLNIEGGKYGTALQAACASEGSGKKGFKLVSLLIEHGADVHVQGGVFGSAWHAAAAQIDLKSPTTNDTMNMLLGHGVHVNDIRGRRHGTALQAALELSQNPARVIPRVRFLLEHGANINVGAGPYGFPLQSACMAPCDGRYESLEILLYLFKSCPDIDVSMTGGRFGTALQAAAYTGNLAAVRQLLGDRAYYESGYATHDDICNATDREAKVNARGGEYGSALDAAVYAGEKDVVEALLIYGAVADARGGKYGTALNAAVIKGYWDLVEILLKAGAKPDCHDLLEPDEDWLKWVEKEDGRGAVERYRKFWELQKSKAEEEKTV
ncbi:hypothetical protein GQ607_007848 [Colletotrichum asianum]|uniref:NACHT domain-containing protein n=1 Tax=Colletotrichum asianum TaxID=702518 RepID=A0A8H3ZV93_9PEZI|nr:hypothetical protein GQ607_007848 [Colletotrichum asianum]